MKKLINKAEWTVTTNAYKGYHPDNLYDVNKIKDGRYESPYEFIGIHPNKEVITPENPIMINIDLNGFYHIGGVDLHRREYGGKPLGFIKEQEILISMDGETWKKIDYKNLNDPFVGKLYEFRTIPKLCRFLQIRVISAEYEISQQASYREVDIYGRAYSPNPNEISSWLFINAKYSSKGEPQSYCPTVRELKSQSLIAEGFLENELPTYGVIKQQF